jgi:hypothetical protein
VRSVEVGEHEKTKQNNNPHIHTLWDLRKGSGSCRSIIGHNAAKNVESEEHSKVGICTIVFCIE